MVRLGGRRVRGRRQMVSVYEVGRRTAATASGRRRWRRRRWSGTRRHAGYTATEHHVQERLGVVERTQLTLDQLALFVVVRVVHLEHTYTHTHNIRRDRGKGLVYAWYCTVITALRAYVTYYLLATITAGRQSSPFGSRRAAHLYTRAHGGDARQSLFTMFFTLDRPFKDNEEEQRDAAGNV